MAVIKTLQTLLGELRTFLRAFNRNLDTGENSLAKDLLLFPYAVAGKAIMDQVGIARNFHILSRLFETDLDNEGTNYKKERLTGAYAIDTLTFYANSLPTVDIVIPAGTQVSTAGTPFASPVTFSTVSEATFAVGDLASYYSYDRSRYEFEVSAVCDEIGTVGNVGTGFLSKLVSSVPNVDGVTNRTAATQGLGEEIDDDFRERIRLAKIGKDLNVVNGLRGYLKELGFIDAYPISVEGIGAERATGVDAFVIDSSIATEVDTFTYSAAQQRYYFSKRPVQGVSSVIATTAGTISAANYSVILDSTSELRRSTEGVDYIEILTSAALSEGETFTVTYTYSELLYNTQATLNLPDNKILTADVLLKKAYEMGLYINASLTLLPNADGASVRNTVRSALSQWLSVEFRLGDSIQKSDLIVVLQTGFGDYETTLVDAVVINSYYLKDEDGVSRLPVGEVISVGNKEYVTLGSATIL